MAVMLTCSTLSEHLMILSQPIAFYRHIVAIEDTSLCKIIQFWGEISQMRITPQDFSQTLTDETTTLCCATVNLEIFVNS